jgi:hypothetical protein
MKISFSDGHQERIDRMRIMEDWHEWFAWCPVRISPNQLAWLETVERKGHWYSQVGWCFEYRGIQAK